MNYEALLNDLIKARDVQKNSQNIGFREFSYLSNPILLSGLPRQSGKTQSLINFALNSFAGDEQKTVLYVTMNGCTKSMVNKHIREVVLDERRALMNRTNVATRNWLEFGAMPAFSCRIVATEEVLRPNFDKGYRRNYSKIIFDEFSSATQVSDCLDVIGPTLLAGDDPIVVGLTSVPR